MRVLVVSAWEPGHTTEGGSLILGHSLPHWSSRHDVRILTASRQAGSSRLDVLPETDSRAGDALGTRQSVLLQSFGRSAPGPLDYVSRRLWGIAHREPAHVRWVLRRKLLGSAQEVIDSGWPEVLHLVGWGTAPLWRLAGPIPTVHMPIDPWSVGLHNRRLPGWRSVADIGSEAAVRRHERLHYPRLGRIVVVAPHDAATLTADIPSARVEVVTNGVLAGDEPAPLTHAPVLAFHGAFEAQANVDAALVLVREVLPLVQRDVPDARVLLIGRDPPAELTALRAPDVEVTGAVDSIRDALGRAAIHVDPMFSGTGLKNKVLEAMAAGLPVVATPLALSGIGEGDGTIEATTSADIAQHVIRLLLDHPLLVKEGACARARVVRDFTWESSARAVETLWQQVTRP
jgi:glycosyltransferase involved in cell wall biosynthesis